MLLNCNWLQPVSKSLAVLQKHLPLGVLWIAYRTPGKNAYKLLASLAQAFEDAWGALCGLAAELDPRTTEQMLPEWERALSLPDVCLPTAGTLAQRRSLLLFRLTKKRWTTIQDWYDLAALFGIKVTITPGYVVSHGQGYANCYPVPYASAIPFNGRFRVYIDLGLTKPTGYGYGTGGMAGPGYPVPYGTDNVAFNAFRCLIERVKPASVVVIWNTYPAICPKP